MDKIILNEIQKHYIDAVRSYEQAINEVDVPKIDYFINLAFLYWSFAARQNEFTDPYNIPDEWAIIGERLFFSTIDKGLQYYPDSLELNFWKRYYAYRIYISDFSKDDCKNLLTEYEDQENLVPYFFLSLFDQQAYVEKIDRLRDICKVLPTAKNLYILSFID